MKARPIENWYLIDTRKQTKYDFDEFKIFEFFENV
jgi:hypothetical protein